VAAAVLDVVAEDPEEEHVPKEVRPASMEEDARDESVVPRPSENPARYYSETVEREKEVVVSTHRLPDEDHEAGDDDTIIDHRSDPCRIIVPYWQHM